MAHPKFTEEAIKEKILHNDAWLFRGIIAIFNRQTEDEKRAEDTKHNNKRGFNSPDARRMTYYAKWILKHGHLDDPHKSIARKKMIKYVGQLTKLANHKLEAT